MRRKTGRQEVRQRLLRRERAAALAAAALLASALFGLSGGCQSPPDGTIKSSAIPIMNDLPPSATPAASARFTDATLDAGLNFVQHSGGCGKNYFVEQVASGSCLLDANGDGYLDIYFPQPKPLGACVKTYADKPPLKQRLYLNDGKGHFTLAPNAFGSSETDYGIAASSGDFDNDGKPDLYVCCFGKNILYHNNGNGTFTDVTKKAGVEVGGFSTGSVWFDYDNDGKLDLYVLRYTEWTLETNIPCPAKNGNHAGCDPLTYAPSAHVLFRNNGDGTFTDVTQKAVPGLPRQRGLGVVAADFDGDGKLDLFVANDLGPNFLLHNNGDGTFEERGMRQGAAFAVSGEAQANMGLAVGDYDNTGRLSVAITTFANEAYTLFRNEGAFFTDVSGEMGIAQPTLPYLGFGTGFIDTHNSGRLDLFFANGHVLDLPETRKSPAGVRQRNQLFLNDGAGHFTEATNALPKDDVRVHRGAQFGDFGNRGKIDILVTANDDRPTLLRNDSEAGNWLLVKLTNKWGCATPVGTKLIATVGGKTLTRVLLGGGSYGGDSDPRVHFGLDKAAQIDKLEIQWLSGKKQTLQNVKPNQILAVHE